MGKIGKALEAQVHLFTHVDNHELLAKYQSSLPELFGVSSCLVAPFTMPAADIDKVFSDKGTSKFYDSEVNIRVPEIDDIPLRIETGRSPGTKCERCWRYTTDVGNQEKYPTVCLRCAEALEAIGFAPYTVQTTEPQA